MRELKLDDVGDDDTSGSRTLPRVRELKQLCYGEVAECFPSHPSRVRELKLDVIAEEADTDLVAPFPGCVN